MVRKVKLPLTVVFLCGAESRYGLAHLEPLIQEKRFRLITVVLPTQDRWEKFRSTLSGETLRPQSDLLHLVLSGFKAILRSSSPLSVLRKIAKAVHMVRRAQGGTDLVVRLCKNWDIPVWFESDVNSSDFIARLSNITPDLLICAAYPQILKQPVLQVPRYGAVNSHPSLLPRCRGAHPVFWAIATGESETGVTMHFMEERIDAGPIITQIRFPIQADDTYSTVYEKALSCVPKLVKQLADFFENNDLEAIPQDEVKATYFREDRTIHRVIFWSVYGAEQIRNLVRAANGGAFFWFRDKRIYVSKCTVSETNRNLTNNISVPNGTVVDVSDGISIKVKDGVVTLIELHDESGKGIKFSVGQVLQ